MKDIARQLKEIIREAEYQFSRMNDDASGFQSSPNEWSKKEILGHLIDSAANNHQRFVRAAYRAAHQFPPYDQNQWVSIQRYNDIPWQTLVAFWIAFNTHLCHVIAQIPANAESSPCNVGKETPVPLAEVVKDYLRHLRHHMNDIVNP